MDPTSVKHRRMNNSRDQLVDALTAATVIVLALVVLALVAAVTWRIFWLIAP